MDPDHEKSLTTPTDAGPQFRPAKGLLIVMGLFVIFGGGLLLALGWLVGVKLPTIMANNPVLEDGPMKDILKVYRSIGISIALIAIGFFILGIGSITLRKWAQKLLLAWGWMLVGFCLMMVIGMLVMVPSMMSMMDNMGAMAGGGSSTPPVGASFSIVMLAGVAINLVFYVLIIGGPGALLIIIYRRKNVELTTRYFHQAACWTDGKPISVLVLWLFFVLGILSLVPMFFGYIEMSVTMGVIDSTRIGNIIVGVLIVVFAILAFGITRLAPWSWWGSIVYFVVCGVFGYYMYATFDWSKLNESVSAMSAIEGDDSSREMQETMQEYQQQSMQSGILVGGIAWMGAIGYLIWIRKHFFGGKSEALEELQE